MLTRRPKTHPVLRSAMAELGLDPRKTLDRKGPHRIQRLGKRRTRVAFIREKLGF